jgi:prepilin-type N-terminal cleavage/methylation domain-containing protein
MISMHTPNTPSMPIQQKGYTLVELGIAIAIVAILVVAGLTGVQNILNSNKVNDQLRTTAKLAGRISTAFSSTSTSGATVATVQTAGGWDPSRVTGTGATTAVRSSFNSTETLAFNSTNLSGMSAGSGFVYVIQEVPQSVCIDLAQGMNNLVYAMAVVNSTRVTATDASWTTSAGTANALLKSPGANTAILLANANTACNLGTTLDFVMLLKP